MYVFILLKEFFEDIRTQKTRAVLTTAAIGWGIIAVVLLMAFGKGLAYRMRLGLINAGDRIIRIYGGQTSKKWHGMPAGRIVRLQKEDCAVIRESVPQAAIVIPDLGRHVHLRAGKKISSTYMEGVYPPFEYLRRMFPAPGGRFINEKDLIERRRVVFLGEVIARELFGKVNPVGKRLHIEGTPFTVIGIMPKKLQTSMNNGPDDRRAIIPFSTFQSMYGTVSVNQIMVKAVPGAQSKQTVDQIRAALARKYRFAPDDQNALFIWDTEEGEKMMNKIFLGINIFLALTGAMTLIIAGVGVANIMFVVAKERTREIGIKRAIGAKRRDIVFQFVFESLVISFSGGLLGLLISLSIIKLMWLLPAENQTMQFLARPIFSSDVLAIALSLLTLIGLLAGYFPARKAAQVSPVDALRYE